MELLNHTIVGGASWPILLAAALILLGVWLGNSVRSRNARMSHGSARIGVQQGFEAPAVASSDAPTIRLSDSKRVDRLHREVTLSAGEPVDLLDFTFDRIPRLRLTFSGFEQEYARIAIELGGAVAGCGSLVKEVAPNQFLVPRAPQEEQRASILHFHGKDEVVNFLRVKVTRLYPERDAVDVDVLHVCGQWAG